MNEQEILLNSASLVSSEVKELQDQQAALNNQQVTGNVASGVLRSEISSGLLPIGPYRQDVDSTYSLEFTLWISEEILRIRKMTIHLTPKASRLATGVAASPGALTAAATGTTVTVSAANHTHIWLSKISATPINSGQTAIKTLTSPSAGPSATTQVTISPHNHVETGGTTNNDTAPVAVGSNTHTHNITTTSDTYTLAAVFSKWGTYNSSGSADANRVFDMVPGPSAPNDMYTTAAQTGDQAVPTPDHTHSVPGHTHSVTLSISESGMANNLHLYIDGVDRSTLLGGPWTAAATIVLDPIKLKTVGFVGDQVEPVTGAHVIKVTSTASGAIEVVGDYSVMIRAAE